ncbi:hypothetical protein [Aquisphaera insulae]|uniref:hypothetical protein n=1 Tax=Aquisphaera insulae TaxID=2712864 RepID=UPI0013EACF55|nr:hypothetical protein [Aquisphaera insulae]
MPQDTPGPDLTEIAAELGKLAPAGSRVNRDRLMYDAGFAAGRSTSLKRGGWIWPSVAAALAVAVVAESATLAVRREPRVVVVERPVPPEEGPAAGLAPVEILVRAAPSPLADQAVSARFRSLVPGRGLEDLPDATPLLSRAEAIAVGGLDRSADSALRRSDTPKYLQPGGPS